MTEKIKKSILDTLKEVEGLDVYGESTVKTIDYNDIKSKRKHENKNLADWNNKDFAIYLLDCFRKKYSKDPNCLLTGTILYMGQIQTSISKSLGFCDNIVFKDYIDFYYDKWASRILQNNKEFYINSLRNEQILKDFAKNYKYEEKLSSPKVNLEKDVESAYKISLETLVIDFGVIISINYLIKNKIDSKQSMRNVAKALVNNRKIICNILEKTNSLGPYPNTLKFRKYKEYLAIVEKMVDQKLDYDVLFTSKKTNWNFLGETKIGE